MLKIDKELLISQHKKDIAFTINNSFSEAVIDRLAKQTKFQKRNRKVPASCFVNTLLFSECNQAHTSLPDLTSDLNQVYNIDISKEAMHKKFTTEAVNFLKELLNTMLSEQLKLNAVTVALVRVSRTNVNQIIVLVRGDTHQGTGNKIPCLRKYTTRKYLYC